MYRLVVTHVGNRQHLLTWLSMTESFATVAPVLSPLMLVFSDDDDPVCPITGSTVCPPSTPECPLLLLIALSGVLCLNSLLSSSSSSCDDGGSGDGGTVRKV